jgi:hypothetical protein
MDSANFQSAVAEEQFVNADSLNINPLFGCVHAVSVESTI